MKYWTLAEIRAKIELENDPEEAAYAYVKSIDSFYTDAAEVE